MKTALMDSGIPLALFIAALSLPSVRSERNCEIVFCIDTSDSMTTARTDSAKTAVVDWSKLWRVDSSHDAKLGVILFSSAATALFSLRDDKSEAEIENLMFNTYNRVRVTGSTALHKCLETSNIPGSGYFSHFSRPISRKYMVIITDGNSNDMALTRNAIANLKANGVMVIAIAIASRNNYNDVYELRKAQSDYFFHLEQYRSLKSNENIRDAICPEHCAGVKVAKGHKCCFDSHIWPASQECPTCDGMPYGSHEKCCHNKYVWPSKSKCGLCAGRPFPPSHKCCYDLYTWPTIQNGCPKCGGNPYPEGHTCCPDYTVVPFNQPCPSPPLPPRPSVLCADPNWYAKRDQCDAHSRCIVDSNGAAQTETQGCECHQFRNDFGICGQAKTCREDPCSDPFVHAWLYHKHRPTKSCRTYWSCDLNSRRTIPRTQCCQPYEYFNEDSGMCELDIGDICHVNCECTPPAPDPCLKYAEIHDASSYYEVKKLSGGKWNIALRRCSVGRTYSRYHCSCIPQNNAGLFIPGGTNLRLDPPLPDQQVAGQQVADQQVVAGQEDAGDAGTSSSSSDNSATSGTSGTSGTSSSDSRD